MIPVIAAAKILTIKQSTIIPEIETLLASAIRRANVHGEIPIMILVLFALCYTP